jgi:hypothetical protein
LELPILRTGRARRHPLSISGLARSLPLAPLPRERVRSMARIGCTGRGRAILLCPGKSDANLFRDGESVVDLDPEIPHRALDLPVAQQKLYCPQIAGTAVDQGRFGPAQ